MSGLSRKPLATAFVALEQPAKHYWRAHMDDTGDRLLPVVSPERKSSTGLSGNADCLPAPIRWPFMRNIRLQGRTRLSFKANMTICWKGESAHSKQLGALQRCTGAVVPGRGARDCRSIDSGTPRKPHRQTESRLAGWQIFPGDIDDTLHLAADDGASVVRDQRSKLLCMRSISSNDGNARRSDVLKALKLLAAVGQAYFEDEAEKREAKARSALVVFFQISPAGLSAI